MEGSAYLGTKVRGERQMKENWCGVQDRTKKRVTRALK